MASVVAVNIKRKKEIKLSYKCIVSGMKLKFDVGSGFFS